jgi:TolB-like protein/Tfp pilus assembly protein PilF
MKRCPECRRDYYDETLLYCLDDGNALLEGPSSADEPKTAILSAFDAESEAATRAQIHTTEKTAAPPLGVADGSRRKSFDKRLLAMPLALIVILFAGFFGYRYFGSSSKQIESIAVMPFVNESGNQDVEYLSDGMTETLIKSLSQIPNLNVKPRSSVFRYKGKDTDLQTIAKELNVQAILNGRVSQRGDQIALNLELVDVSKDSVIWTESYNRKQSDLVVLQSEIARDVSTNLKAKLSGADEQKVTRSYTGDSEAYQLYLKGRYHWNKRTSEDLEKAVNNFKAAIERDDQFALSYSGLADTYSVLQYYQGSRSNEFINKAMPYAVRAVELDDKLAEAHSSLAFVNEGSWKWAEAEREYQRALQLNPNYSSALLRFGRFDIRVPKRDTEGMALIKRAVEIEPSSPVINDNLSQLYLSQGKSDLALVQAKKTVELDPNFSFGWIDLAYSQLKNGQIDDARTSAEKVVAVTERSSRSLVCSGFVAAASGHRDEAKVVLKELEQRYADRQADGTDVAALYAGLEDKEQVFAWLDRAFSDHSSLLVDLRAEYPFARLLEDPQFKDLRKRMNMPE